MLKTAVGCLRASIVAAALLTATASSGAAASRTATPETLVDVVRRAQPGDQITLAPGEYRDLRISRCHFDPSITLDATKATLYGLLFTSCDGIRIVGGEFRLPAPTISPRTGADVYGAALRFDRSNNIVVRNGRFVGPGHPDTGGGFAYGEGKGVVVSLGDNFVLEDSTFTGFAAGVAIARVDNFRVSRITSTGMRSDGVDIAESHHGVVEYVKCSGTTTRDTEHPDCIQGWSRQGSPPTSDLVIRHNSVLGNTQGISFFNHADRGRDDGGFDRITIEDNDVEVGFTNGIALIDGRDSVVRRNHVRTLEGSRYRAIVHAPGARTCENVVGSGAGKAGYSDEKC